MDIKNLIGKVDGAKVLSIAVTALGVAGTLLSTKVESNNRKALKDQLKQELIDELTNK